MYVLINKNCQVEADITKGPHEGKQQVVYIM